MMRLWVMAAVLAPGLAFGQAKTAQEFAAVLQNAGHHATVLAAARASPAWAAVACPAARFDEAPEVGVYLPVEFDSAGTPVAGEWREGLVVSGCGAVLTLNVLTKVTAPAVLATGPLLPGGTIADPALQNAAQAYAVAAAGGVPAGCKQAFVADTSFAGYEGSGSPAPWKEIWVLNFCGARWQVPLHFIPDALGTKVIADPAGGK